jgi:hypothetical protein
MSIFYVLVCVDVLAVVVQAGEHAISADGFGTLKATTNIGDINAVLIANEASASAVFKIALKKTGSLKHLEGLVRAESSVPGTQGKVNVIKCAYMVV